MHKELRKLVEAAEAGDTCAISVASELGLSLLKQGKADSETIRDACKALAIAGMNGTVCEHGVLIPCLANKVIRVQTSLGRITPGADVSFTVPHCSNLSCTNHPMFECEPLAVDPLIGYNEPDEYRHKSLELWE